MDTRDIATSRVPHVVRIPETIGIASKAGFRCFTSATEFKRHLRSEVLADNVSA